MDVKVLGPFEAHEDGSSVVPTAGKPRQILALLALNNGRVVTGPALMEEIWGGGVPRSAATTLQTYILQLRRRIAAALAADPTRDAKEVLVTRHGGYLLDIRPGHTDADEYARLARAGRSAFDDGDPQTASQVLHQALALWHGPALVDVYQGPLLELEVLRLTEDQMATLERRIDADLQLGRHAELVPELQVLAARHRLHESFTAQLMTALCRSGAGWRALEAYQRLRAALVDELGMEPSPKLQRLHQAVLASDPVLDPPTEPAQQQPR